MIFIRLITTNEPFELITEKPPLEEPERLDLVEYIYPRSNPRDPVDELARSGSRSGGDKRIGN